MKWARTREELQRLSDVDQNILEAMSKGAVDPQNGPLIELEKHDGSRVAGYITHHRHGNNGGVGGWQCYGVVVLKTANGEVEVDLMDVKLAFPRSRA